MGKFQDLTGKRFGRWEVLGESIRKGNIYYIKCKCSCGTEKFVRKTSLMNGTSISCGCWLSRSKAIRNARNIIGQKYNRLTIVSLVSKKLDNSRGLVAISQCDCGKVYEVKLSLIKSGHVKSCGCLNIEKLKTEKRHYKNGISDHPLYRKLTIMKRRCYDIKNNRYNSYGAKGIKICEEWLKDIWTFIDWGIKTGWKKGMTIDRIDPKGHYEPNNCQWLSVSENSKKANKERKKPCSI